MVSRNFLCLLMAVATGLLIGTSHVGSPPWALLFGFAPLWLSWLIDPRPGQVFFRGWITQFIFMMSSFYWVSYAANQYGHLSIVTSLIVLLLYSSVASLYYPFAGWTWAILNKKIYFSKTQSILLIACLTFIYETFFPAIFPWNMGYPWFWANLPVYQWADYIGFIGLSFITYLFNFLFTVLWLRRHDKKQSIMLVVIILSSFIVLQLSGYEHGKFYKKYNTNLTPINILIVQGNIGNNEKLVSEKTPLIQQTVINNYLKLTSHALSIYPDSDLIVWPETAMPVILNEDARNSAVKNVFDYLAQNKLILLSGGYYKNRATQQLYNSAYLINGDKNFLGIHHKSLLLMFGEYIPGADIFPFLRNIVPEISHLTPGNQLVLFPFKQFKMGVQICYESLYPQLSRTMSLQGANFLVNLTNDSWFGGGLEATQHLYLTMARAIEFRIPLIRSTNTGISTVINSDGSYQVISPFGKIWYHGYKVMVSPVSQPTFYAQYGYYFPWLICMSTFLYIIVIAINGGRLKNK